MLSQRSPALKLNHLSGSGDIKLSSELFGA